MNKKEIVKLVKEKNSEELKKKLDGVEKIDLNCSSGFCQEDFQFLFTTICQIKPNKVKSLFLIECNIEKIDLEQLHQLKKTLSRIVLSRNNIKKMRGLNIFPYVGSKITMLDLNSNNIQKIEGLNNRNQLTYLNLSSNNIQKIEGIKDLRKLTYLNLSSNKIQKIEKLHNLRKLTYLNLSSNEIQKIELSYRNKQLTQLYLNSNNIQKIEKLNSLNKLTYLDLSDNNIQKIEGLNKLNKLTMLKLNGNQIKDICGLENLIIDVSKITMENEIKKMYGEFCTIKKATHLSFNQINVLIKFYEKNKLLKEIQSKNLSSNVREGVVLLKENEEKYKREVKENEEKCKREVHLIKENEEKYKREVNLLKEKEKERKKDQIQFKSWCLDLLKLSKNEIVKRIIDKLLSIEGGKKSEEEIYGKIIHFERVLTEITSEIKYSNLSKLLQIKKILVGDLGKVLVGSVGFILKEFSVFQSQKEKGKKIISLIEEKLKSDEFNHFAELIDVFNQVVWVKNEVNATNNVITKQLNRNSIVKVQNLVSEMNFLFQNDSIQRVVVKKIALINGKLNKLKNIDKLVSFMKNQFISFESSIVSSFCNKFSSYFDVMKEKLSKTIKIFQDVDSILDGFYDEIIQIEKEKTVNSVEENFEGMFVKYSCFMKTEMENFKKNELLNFSIEKICDYEKKFWRRIQIVFQKKKKTEINATAAFIRFGSQSARHIVKTIENNILKIKNIQVEFFRNKIKDLNKKKLKIEEKCCLVCQKVEIVKCMIIKSKEIVEISKKNEKLKIFVEDFNEIIDSLKSNLKRIENSFEKRKFGKRLKKIVIRFLEDVEENINIVEFLGKLLQTTIKNENLLKVIEENETKILEEFRKIVETKGNGYYAAKRELELNNKIVRKNVDKVLPFLKSLIDEKFENEFLEFLKKKQVLVDRDLGDYQILQEISTSIFKVKLKSDLLNSKRIIKVLLLTPQNEKQSQNEIEKVLKVDHPSIIKINEIFVFSESDVKKIGIDMNYYEQDLLFWLKGKDQRRLNYEEYLDLLKQRNEQPVNLIKSVFRKILDGVNYLHETHDLKFSNILINNENDVKIIDFGASKDDNLTITHINPQATVRYLCPEKQRTKKSDIYSLGIVIKETFIKPEDVDLDFETIQKKQYLSYDVVEILQKFLEVNPKKRMSAKEALNYPFFNFEVQKFQNEIREKNIESINLFRKEFYSKNIKINKNKIIKMTFDRKSLLEKRKVMFSLHRIIKEKNNLLLSAVEDSSIDVEKVKEEIVGKEQDLDSIKEKHKLLSTKFILEVLLIFEQSNLNDLFQNLFIRFENEAAIDQGGVTRVLFTLFCECLENCDVFEKEGKMMYLPSDKKDYSKELFLFGKMLCRCFFESRNLCFPFGSFLFSFILNQIPKTLKEWEFFYKIYCPLEYKNVVYWTLNQPVKNLRFIYGDEITEKNKLEFIKRIIIEKFYGSKFRKNNLIAIKKGFYSLFPKKRKIFLINCLNSFEFEKLIIGRKEIEANLLINNINFRNECATVENYLKRFIVETNSKKRKVFLEFCTGLKGLPLDGILRKDQNPHKITLRFINPLHFQSHTCGFILELSRNFQSYEQFKEKLIFLLKESAFCEMFA